MELGIDHEDDIMQIDELAFGGRQKEEITYKEIVGKFL